MKGLRPTICAATAAACLFACATPSVDDDGERLDEVTGTTVTVMPRPIELVAERARDRSTDPFVYLAPFETNRMGTHEMFLWVSAPQIGEPLNVPRVFCGDSAVPLEEFTGTVRDMGLSNPPYKRPAPWSMQWYFRLPGEALDCFASTVRIRVETQAGNAQPDSYVAQGEALTPIGRFVSRVRT